MKILILSLLFVSVNSFAQTEAGCNLLKQKAELSRQTVLALPITPDADYARAMLSGIFGLTVKQYALCLKDQANDKSELRCAAEDRESQRTHSLVTNSDPAEYNNDSLKIDQDRVAADVKYLECLNQ